MSRKLVLVADDQEPIRTMLKMSLEFMGYEVAVAENGKALLALARERVPDLIITDVMMPEMTGYEALEELRKDEALAKVPVIVLTALEEASYQEKSTSYGVMDHLVKPISLPVLKAKVKRVLELAAG
jgi:CheY-like chemotaxis protein